MFTNIRKSEELLPEGGNRTAHLGAPVPGPAREKAYGLDEFGGKRTKGQKDRKRYVRLNETQRAMLVRMLYVEKVAVREIADRLNISTSAVFYHMKKKRGDGTTPPPGGGPVQVASDTSRDPDSATLGRRIAGLCGEYVADMQKAFPYLSEGEIIRNLRFSPFIEWLTKRN